MISEPVVEELCVETVAKENQVVVLCKSDIESIDNLLDKSVGMGNTVLGGVSLGGEDVSLGVEHELENQDGAYESKKEEQSGLKENEGSKAEPDSVEVAHECKKEELSGLKENNGFEDGPENVKVEPNIERKDGVIDSSQMKGVQIPLAEQVENLDIDMSKNIAGVEKNEWDDDVVPYVQSTPLLEETDEEVRVVVLAAPALNAYETPRRGRQPKALSMKKSPKQLSVVSKRLRSRFKEVSKDPVPEPSVNLETTKKRRGRKKANEKNGKPDDEFSKMRKHLKYLLYRIQREQSLLDAYSSEGWRGQSIEKLRPEKELQRAKADINRFKLKIRDLFHRLDSMSAEGKFPETLYDSEGLIDSEDIFCAKCGSKDLSIDNDIILCDGICERGFHQYCLDPPLLTEDVPPGDEGWLCPTCDCKLDCVELLNDYQGTRLAIEDNWENVFPEAVAAMTDKGLDDVMGLPSDDSEDNEYNPDGTDEDANVEGNESSSAESDSDESDPSDFSSVSEDLEPTRGAEENLGLPSDDSEDDDFNPDAANADEVGVEHESSSSDFTSASEDLGVAIGDDGASDINELPLPLEPEQDFSESPAVTSKRHVERLDYKKLYDETYGNVALDSSDDEEWTGLVGTRKRKFSAKKAVPLSSLGASVSVDGTSGSGTSRRRGRPKANLQEANGSSAPFQGSSQKKGSSGSSKKRTPYNRLGEAVTQRLYESFKENQYPDREAKGKLANELGLTAFQVDKWFGNARWSLHHHPSRVEASMSRAISQPSIPHNVACNGDESALADTDAAVPECGSVDMNKLNVASTPEKSGKGKKNTEGDQSVIETSMTENLKEGTVTGPLEIAEASRGKMQRKRRKRGA